MIVWFEVMFVKHLAAKIKVPRLARTRKVIKKTSKKLSKIVVASGKTLRHKVLKPLHFHLAQRPHNHMMSRGGKYKQWHEWRFHKHTHLATAGLYALLVVVLVFSNIPLTAAAETWAQTDWSGGQGASTTNQYSSATDIDETTAGQVSLPNQSDWSSTYEDWKYRTEITFDNTTANLGTTSETLVNFPVLVTLNSSRIDYANTDDAGADIRFTDPDGTVLSYELEKWNEAGSSYVWVRIPQIDIDSNADSVYIYYGNDAAADASDPDGVWPSNEYSMVYHFDEAFGAGTVSDATGNTSGTVQAGTALGQSGRVGDAADFTTSVGGIALGSVGAPTLTASTTVSFWIRSTDYTTPARQNPYGQAYGGWGTMTIEINGTISWFHGSNGANGNVYAAYPTAASYMANNQWIHVTLVRNNSNKTYAWYKNGASNASGGYNATFPVIASQPFNIGDDYVNNVAGKMDEFRVHKTYRSAAWVDATYHSETDDFTSYGAEEGRRVSTGSLTSNILDATYPANWEILNYTYSGSGTVSVKARTSDDSGMSGAPDFSSCVAISSGSTLSDNACVSNVDQYIQYEITLTPNADESETPVFENIEVNYVAADPVAPITNASNTSMYTSFGGNSIVSNQWTNAAGPYFAWDEGEDDVGGVGLKGYCLYLGQDSGGDPISTKGLLGTSPVEIDSDCQFIVASNSVDLSTAGYIGSAMTTSENPYYLNIKAVDLARNVFDGASEQFQFRYDGTDPSNPSFITAPSQFVADKEVTLTWETAGGSAASDANSSVAGLQYRIGSGGTWYGDSHSGAEDATDLLTNDGSYTTIDPTDFDALVEGNNIVYFRTYDTAGNASDAFITTVVKLNTTSPSSPQNVTATPDTNTTNSFAFSWLAPATYTGNVSNITYCYTINTLPTLGTCNFTDAGETSLSADAYATQPGENTFYVVAKDEAGNINYATYESTTFTANTPAPGISQNTEIADISVKSTSNWKIALSWEEPEDVGAGVANYKVYRSLDNDTFSLAATTSATSYVDQGLAQVTYYYYVKACDSANNCGAASTTVDLLPTGRYTEPAELITQPTATDISTRKATVSWATGRGSDSKVAIGTKSGVYGSEEVSNSTQTTQHELSLSGLDPGTTYYYVARWTDEDGNTGTSAEKSFKTLPAPTVKNVKVRRTLLTSAVIDFTSTSAVKVNIYYGKSDGFGGKVTINTSSSESDYTTELSGLDDGTNYYYKLNPVDGDGNEYDGTTLSFETPPRPQISNLRVEPVEDAASSTQRITWTTNVPASSLVRYSGAGRAAGEVVESKLSTDHSITISDLVDRTEYSVVAESRDKDGNLAISDTQVFETPLDTRPPEVDGVVIETSIRGSGASSRGQFIVSWKTDEPATSQVAFGQGTTGDFTNKSAEDAQLVTDHVVVVSDLPTSTVFHVKPLSRDNAGNQGEGPQQTAIIGRASESILTIIINTMQKIFGL